MIKNRNSVQHRRRAGKWPPFTGLAEQAPRPAGHFRSRLALESAEDKKNTPNPALRVKEKLLAVLKIIVKRSGQMKTIQAQCNFSATKWIYRGVETILLKSYLGWVPSTMCLKSIVTGHDDYNQRQVQCQPLSGVAGRS